MRALRSAIADIITPFDGRIFSTAGDGFMLEFPSAESGVEAALALLKARDAGEPPLPSVHIGLHLGDVIDEENGDLMGHGVNVAARLQAMADPGTALVSEAVRSQVRSAAGVALVPKGRVQLDKMDERISVFPLSPEGARLFGKLDRRIALRALGGTGVLAAGATGVFFLGRTLFPARPGGDAAASVAVLPFDNVTERDEDATFVAGLHDDLLNRLAQITSLRVIARTSVLGYAGTTTRVNQIASELDVDAVLEGSVQRSAERVRVAVQLIDGPSERQRWAQAYDRELTADNLFDIQGDIAEAIARALNAALTAPEITAVGSGGTRNLEAYQAYVDGRLLLQSGDTNSNTYRQARAQFEIAVQHDPNYAAAYAGKTQAIMAEYWQGPPDSALRDAARLALDRAEALAPNAPETQVALAYYLYWGFYDYPRALTHIDRALRSAPSNVEALIVRAAIGRRTGAFDRGLEDFEQALRLDPHNQRIRGNVSTTARALGQFSRAEAVLQGLDQSLPWVRWEQANLLIGRDGNVQGAWNLVKDLRQPVLGAALLTRDPANIEFAIESWPVEQRRPEPFPEAYEAYRAEALLQLGREAEARAILREVSARLQAAADPYPSGWRAWFGTPTPAFIPGLLGDAAGVRAAERDYLDNAPPDEFNKLPIWFELAMDFLRVGDADRAMHYLEGRCDLFGAHQYMWASVDPAFDALRSHPRYHALRARYEAWSRRQRDH